MDERIKIKYEIKGGKFLELFDPYNKNYEEYQTKNIMEKTCQE
jgi:hypothetical protein